MRRTLAVAAFMVAVATACGGSDGGSGAGNPSSLEVGLKEFSFIPRQMKAAAGEVTFEVRNKGEMDHTLVIFSGKDRVAGTEPVKASAGATLRTELQPGSYDVVCVLPGHRPAGMEGVLEVE